MANDVNDAPSVEPPSGSVSQSDKARGTFDVRSKRTGNGNNKKMYLGIAAIVIVFLVLVVSAWALVISKMQEGSTEVDESKVKGDATLDVAPGGDDSMSKAREETMRKIREQEEREQREKAERERQEAKAQADKPSPDRSPNRDSNSPARSAPANGQPVALTPAQRKLAGGVVVSPVLQDVSASGATVAGNSESDRTTGQPLTLPTGLGGGMEGGLGGGSASRTRGSLSNLGGTGFPPSKAVLAPSRKYLLAHNTYTRCALYTEIVTDHPGLIECRLTEPVYSADGSTVLADAGDRLTGEQNIEMQAGQVRIFTSWSELETQSGVRARLDSLGAGPLGASGTEGWINNHYRQRFGGAVMLTVIQDVLQSVSNATQKGDSGSGYTVNNSEQNVENMASKALESTINIAPTGYLLPGTVMTVIVARDIDFSSVYENR